MNHNIAKYVIRWRFNSVHEGENDVFNSKPFRAVHS